MENPYGDDKDSIERSKAARRTILRRSFSSNDSRTGEIVRPPIPSTSSLRNLKDVRDEGSSLWDSLLPSSFLRPANSNKIHVTRVALLFDNRIGNRKEEKVSVKCVDLFRFNGVEVDPIPIRKNGQMRDLCKSMEARRYDVLCVLGGDDLFHEAVNGFIERDDGARLSVPLALLPGVNGENLYSLEIYRSHVEFGDLKRNVDRIVRGICSEVDLCSIFFPTEERTIYSFRSLRWGTTKKAAKSVTKTFLEMIDRDGKVTRTKEEISVCLATMTGTFQPGVRVAPEAKINDGLIDLLLVKSKKQSDLSRFLSKSQEPSQSNLKLVDYRQVKSFLIVPVGKNDLESSVLEATRYERAESEENIFLEVDGKMAGTAPFKCTVLPSSLRLIL
eukprot:TRINITY_DN5283_c0_g1_i1.p1 TRINITY_DN5283_c0_g1~~TRINITY_DN5283_c0_g1_i1.p1  ORF type:complete len:388 (+),score=66.71 TRINITY_DN5283_c0_g1_i1:83-1246(+)